MNILKYKQIRKENKIIQHIEVNHVKTIHSLDECNEDEFFSLEKFEELDNPHDKLEYFAFSNNYPENINEKTRNYIINEASKNLFFDPHLCSLCLSLITSYPFQIDDFNHETIQNVLEIVKKYGSKYKSLIDFLIKFSILMKKSVFDDIGEILTNSILYEDICLFKLCMSQIELGNIPKLDKLKEILIILRQIEQISFLLKENVVLLFANVLTRTNEKVYDWIWENKELIENLIDIDDLSDDNLMLVLIAINFDNAYKIKTNEYSYLHENIVQILKEI